MKIIIICLCIVIVIMSIIGAVLLFNFMQLLSTLNKRLVAVISDILSNIDLSTPQIDSLVDKEPKIDLKELLEDDNDYQGEGFNPHNYDPFKEEENN